MVFETVCLKGLEDYLKVPKLCIYSINIQQMPNVSGNAKPSWNQRQLVSAMPRVLEDHLCIFNRTLENLCPLSKGSFTGPFSAKIKSKNKITKECPRDRLTSLNWPRSGMLG